MVACAVDVSPIPSINDELSRTTTSGSTRRRTRSRARTTRGRPGASLRLSARAAARVLLLREMSRDRRDDVAKPRRSRIVCEPRDVALEEVRRPPRVLVSPMGDDPVEAWAGASGERERANNSVVRAETLTGGVPMTHEHHELRKEAHAMTGRPAASRWPPGSDANHLLGRRERAGQHRPLAASRRPELRRRLRHSSGGTDHDQPDAAEGQRQCGEAHQAPDDRPLSRFGQATIGRGAGWATTLSI